ncbi:HAD family hydrolase [Brachybacterium sp. J153]|uniref:HAD family hydrolase n=1 Tax=Brachybacterium sp. J153 TaxID=3116488 RepID=UPI002E79175D|nr:HAD family hydrolase [Brachybacterium sp. J153]MEE1617433.1 HAD family hydrolase [Brachybacterium sp. J153]
MRRPPLVLLDLDGTLVDRQRAFEDWARSFLDGVGAGPGDLDWLVEADRGGYRPRAELAAEIRRRLRPEVTAEELHEHLCLGVVEGISAYPGIIPALQSLRGIGAELVLVTNGTVVQQTAKLERTGLGRLLDRVVISEAAGVAKPDPRIFARAVDGMEARGETWMIGDHPTADIEGGRAAGFSTGWVSHGRPWPHPWKPTLSAPTTAELLQALVSGARGPVSGPL